MKAGNIVDLNKYIQRAIEQYGVSMVIATVRHLSVEEIARPPYETSPEGDQFLRGFIIKWMQEKKLEVPAARSPSELLEEIVAQTVRRFDQ